MKTSNDASLAVREWYSNWYCYNVIWTLWWDIEFEDFPLKALHVVQYSSPVLYHLYLSRWGVAVLITLWQSKCGCGPKVCVDVDLSLSSMLLFSFSVDYRCFMLKAQQNESNNYVLLVYLYRYKCTFILVIIYSFHTQQSWSVFINYILKYWFGRFNRDQITMA